MKSTSRGRGWTVLIVVLAGIGAAGCDLLGSVTGTYTGPLPSRDDLVLETVIVREVRPAPEGGSRLILDRVRYLDRDRSNVNRVIEAYTAQVEPAFTRLDVRTGDRLVVSSRYSSRTETGELSSVPDWAG